MASYDRYLKRDELGVVFQLCVSPGLQRRYVGAAIMQEVFARSAYGCRLYCLWCAQDLKANEFWEAMGFTPIAFRAGSDKKRRVHIFWQKKIIKGDTETKWWYPFQTTGGAIRADRMVFPIPEGTHWRDVRAVELPVDNTVSQASRPRELQAKKDAGETPTVRRSKPAGPTPMGGFRFQAEVSPAKPAKVKPAESQSAAAKIDPKFLAVGRELRDRWLEHVNAGKSLLESAGKYDLTRENVNQSAGPVWAAAEPRQAALMLPAV